MGSGLVPAGQQIARTIDGATTLSLGSDTIVLNTAGSATKILREYPFPSNTLHYQAMNPKAPWRQLPQQ